MNGPVNAPIHRPARAQPDEWLEPTYRALRAALHDERRLKLAATHMANLRRCLRLMIDSGALIDDSADPSVASDKKRLLEIMTEARKLAEYYESLWGLPEMAPEPDAQPDLPLFATRRETPVAVAETPCENSAPPRNLPPQQDLARAKLPSGKLAPPPGPSPARAERDIDLAALADLLARGPLADGRTAFIAALTGPYSVYRMLKAKFDLSVQDGDRILRRLVDRGEIVIEPRGLPPHGRVRPVIRVTRPASRR